MEDPRGPRNSSPLHYVLLKYCCITAPYDLDYRLPTQQRAIPSDPELALSLSFFAVTAPWRCPHRWSPAAWLAQPHRKATGVHTSTDVTTESMPESWVCKTVGQKSQEKAPTDLDHDGWQKADVAQGSVQSSCRKSNMLQDRKNLCSPWGTGTQKHAPPTARTSFQAEPG